MIGFGSGLSGLTGLSGMVGNAGLNFSKRARLDVSTHTSALMECGALNAYYGTTYRPEDL